jgi:hypothetical protein
MRADFKRLDGLRLLSHSDAALELQLLGLIKPLFALLALLSIHSCHRSPTYYYFCCRMLKNLEVLEVSGSQLSGPLPPEYADPL